MYARGSSVPSLKLRLHWPPQPAARHRTVAGRRDLGGRQEAASTPIPMMASGLLKRGQAHLV